jgi:hypothetical protein
MFEIHLSWFSKKGQIGLTFPPTYRFVSLGLGLVLLAASFAGGPPALAGLFFSVLFCLGALYEERWTFSSNNVTFRWGLVFWADTRRWDKAQIEELSLSLFRRGLVPGATEETRFRRGRPQWAVLSLHFTDGTSRVLERRPARHRTELEETAQRLADTVGVMVSRETSW